MMWISFRLAAEEVERRLGVSWGAAQKLLLEACENEEVTWQQQASDGPDVPKNSSYSLFSFGSFGSCGVIKMHERNR
jgi:hypothetical protein